MPRSLQPARLPFSSSDQSVCICWHIREISELPISEALLDQSVRAVAGNIAKSEILFPTVLDPRIPANEVAGAKLDRLLESIRRVLWASYHAGAAGCAKCITATASGAQSAAA